MTNQWTMTKFLLTFLFLLIFTFGFSQVNISKSTKIITESGITFYIHNVEQGHTIYSLTKAYGVTEQDLLKYNPVIKDGLKVGQELKIIKIDAVTKIAVVDMSASPTDTIAPKEYGFIFHKVEPGETLYRIMKKYQISLDNLSKYNPGLSANLQPGQFIKIPTEETLIAKIAEQQYDSIIEYTVRKRDNYSKLERKYRINQLALEQLNPILKSKGLQQDMVIKIPYAPDVEAEEINTVIEIKPAVIEQPADSVIVKRVGCDSNNAKSGTYKIGLMMPLYSNTEKDIRTDNEYFMKSAENYQAFRFIEYYEGFLMAVDSMKALGFNAEIYVYDTNADSNLAKSITQKPEFSELDLVFGPFFARNLKQVVPVAKANNTKVISPFSTGAGLDNYNNLFVIESSNRSLWNNGMNYINDSLSTSHVYVLHIGNPSELRELWMIRQLYLSKSKSDSLRFHVYNYKTAGFKQLMIDLKKDRDNVIINLVNSEAMISSFVRQLSQKRDDYPMILMGTEEQWTKFNTLEDEYLVNLRLTLLSNSFIDYHQAAVQRFAKDFRLRYNTDPHSIGYKGFDEGMYFMQLLYNYGRNFTPCMNEFEFSGVHNDFNFSGFGGGKWTNTYGCVYQYFDYQLVDKRKSVIPFIENPEDNSEQKKVDLPVNPVE